MFSLAFPKGVFLLASHLSNHYQLSLSFLLWFIMLWSHFSR